MTGTVYLVGAGPGDEGLLTLRGLELLESAQVVVYDYLANPRFLKHCREDCEKIYVGKKADNHTMPQEEINALLAQKAREGKRVVRLKGGDPYTFGRGGEEGLHLRAQGVPFEVVPGVTSAIGGLAYGGIPVTHRNLASSFHVIAGHLSKEHPEGEEKRYRTYGELEGTLVFLMGARNIHRIAARLMEAGKSPTTPAAVLYRATTPRQEVVEGTLETIGALAHREEKPGLLVVGEVVRLRKDLDFLSRRPLFGKKILVTRADRQNGGTLEAVSRLGGWGVEWPTIRIRPVPEGMELLKVRIREMEGYSHLVFTSQNGVELFFQVLKGMGRDARHLGKVKVHAVGKVTAQALDRQGILCDTVATTFHSEAFARDLLSQLEPGQRVLAPRSRNSRPVMVERLKDHCILEEVFLYETVEAELEEGRVLEDLEGADYVLFTSASTVENFHRQLERRELQVPRNLGLVSIGPVTSEAIRGFGLEPLLEGDPHTIEGMMERLVAHVEKEKGGA
ncbi:uroporphyrinogen-III C-methyltransferase [Anaerotalea alkaliphila]|uniref:uroporphyrinogen-III C-methyltransferase n=1 Tax=Anaerotalea alkaliphila TaxID=2662126 RepID=A0A7X5HT83_9FIRM|nr:uroporphyrinogen-III C-methyltransferase [Anaerotalea alkaliphila]NDL66237.1 uroporphyrinogen-III C-methyltransferase [Anaerotalea alkaliphila]